MSFRQRYGDILFSKKFAKAFGWRLFSFASWLPVAYFVQTHVGDVAWISGASMYPYLNTDFNRSMKKDVCYTWKWDVPKNLQRGMIVTFWSPYNPETRAVKRIIAVEGDTVQTRSPYPFSTAVIPEGHIWVEGDAANPKDTLDSNTYGPISKSLVLGRVTHVLWPPSSFGPIRWWEFRPRTRVWKAEEPIVDLPF